MYLVSRGTLRSELNTYTGDASNVIWSEEQKNLAINMAIKSAWPEIHKKTREQFTLSEGSYVYIINAGDPELSVASATRAPWGPAQIFVATAVSPSGYQTYRELRRSVVCRIDGAAWSLEFDKEFVDNHDGYKIEVHFEQMYPGLDSDDEETEVPEDYIIPRALFELCGMEALKGHHTDVATFRQERPNFYEQAERAKARHRRLPLPRTIKIRWE